MDQDLNKLILSALSCEGADLRTYNALSLAFLGDSVYELYVRTWVVGRGNVSPGKLNSVSAYLCSARFQSRAAEHIEEQLSEEEADVFRRGKNSKPNTMAKNASKEEYLKATGLEALFGYLYLKGDTNRLLELFSLGMEIYDGK